MLRRGLAFFVLLGTLCACGGGSSSFPAAPGASSAPTGSQNIGISILIPSAVTTSGVLRRPAYVSSQTQSVAISVNGGSSAVTSLAAGASTCTTSSAGRTCNLTVSAPTGTDTFSTILYASTNGTGSPLSQGTVSATIVAGKSNTVALTLDGVPNSIVLKLANPTPAQNTATQIGLTVTVKDASGAAIIGGDPFTSPITLSDSDHSSVTSLSAAKLNSPNDAANLSVKYSGAALASPAILGASTSGVSSANITPATLSPQSTAAVTFNDYTTYGYDNAHDGFNPNSSTITPASISSMHVAWQVSLNGDSNTQTQPVLATNLPGTTNIAAGHSAVLFIGAGTSGNVYAYDALSGAHLWTKGLGVEQFSCNKGDGPVNFGVGGTAVYDAASKSLYVVGNSNPHDNATAANTLFHLDAATGQTLGSVNFAPHPLSAGELDFSHTSVTLGSNGIAYVGTGATCDISSWRGRVAAVSVPSMTLVNTMFTVWNSTNQPWGGGGVWGYGGVSLDAAGNVFTGVGNTDNGTTSHGSIVAPFQASPAEYSGNGDAFLELSSDLSTVTASNHPIANNVYGSSGVAGDLDINGTPVIFKPNGVACDTMAAIQGKAGALYLYDATRINAGPVGQYQSSPPAYTDAFLGNPAYSPVSGLLYSPIPVGSGSLYAPGMVAINPGCGAPSVAWHTQFGPDSDSNGASQARSVPAVSAGGVVFVGTPCAADTTGGCAGDLTITTGTSAASRAIASVRKALLCCSQPGNTIGGAVWALNAATGEVLNGGKPLFTTPGILRMPPTIDGNWVFVIDNGGDMYGMTIDSSVPAVAAAKYRTVDSSSRRPWEPLPRIPQTHPNS